MRRKKISGAHKFRVYFRLFAGNYKHPKPLFYRLFIEYAAGSISEDEFLAVFVAVTNFMIESLTFANHESKDVITMFANIFAEIYEHGVNPATIIYFVAKESDRTGITKELLKTAVSNYDAYTHKNIAVPLLALYEAFDDKTEKLSFDQADVIASKFSESFALDHLLVQTPRSEDSEYRYFCKKEDGYETLVLKQGHDFPEKIQDGMSYDDFKSQILNRFGNVRICYSDKNSSRKNNAIALKDYGRFTTYADIVNHEKRIVDFLVEKILTIPSVNLADEPRKAKKAPARLPKMEELVDAGLVSIGDKLYITVSPGNSEAVLVTPTTVDFKGTRMTLNQWGQLITGWKAIQIYGYVCIVGETETLAEKRNTLLGNG